MIYDELLGMPMSETVYIEPKNSPKSPGVFVSLCDREFYENPARFIMKQVTLCLESGHQIKLR